VRKVTNERSNDTFLTRLTWMFALPLLVLLLCIAGSGVYMLYSQAAGPVVYGEPVKRDPDFVFMAVVAIVVV